MIQSYDEKDGCRILFKRTLPQLVKGIGENKNHYILILTEFYRDEDKEYYHYAVWDSKLIFYDINAGKIIKKIIGGTIFLDFSEDRITYLKHIFEKEAAVYEIHMNDDVEQCEDS